MPISFRGTLLELPFSETTIGGSTSLFDYRSASYFDPLSLYIYCTPFLRRGEKTENIHDYMKILRDEVNLASTPTDALAKAIELTAIIHESRHFHDVLCTPYGFQTFMYSNFNFAQYFSQAFLSALREREIHSASTTHSNSKETIDDMKDDAVVTAINLTNSPIVILADHETEADFYEVVITGIHRPIRFPGLYVNFTDENGVPYRAIWPLNFTLIAECLAMMEQQGYFRDIDEDLSAQYVTLVREQNPLGPYLPIFISYIRSAKRLGFQVPSDGYLYAACSRSLYVSWFQDKATNRICAAGWELVSLLDGCPLETGEPDDNWPSRPDYDEIIERAKHITEYLLDYNSEYLDEIHRIVNKYLINPINEIKSRSIQPCSRQGYTLLQSVLPQPAVVFWSDGDAVVHDKQLYKFTMSLIFGRGAFLDLVRGDTLTCPVQHDFTRHLFGEHNFPHGEMCSDGISNGTCGKCTINSAYEGPDCVWRNHISELISH
jgi:hypothetical protein